jgi:hypothetical protein
MCPGSDIRRARGATPGRESPDVQVPDGPTASVEVGWLRGRRARADLVDQYWIGLLGPSGLSEPSGDADCATAGLARSAGPFWRERADAPGYRTLRSSRNLRQARSPGLGPSVSICASSPPGPGGGLPGHWSDAAVGRPAPRFRSSQAGSTVAVSRMSRTAGRPTEKGTQHRVALAGRLNSYIVRCADTHRGGRQEQAS